MFDYVGILVKI